MTDWTYLDNRVLDPSWYLTDEYHDAFRELRNEEPIHWTVNEMYGKNFWLLSRHEDVSDYLLANTQFSNRLGTRPPRTPERITPEERYELHQDTQVSHLDEPWHGVYRRPINKHFSVPAIGRLSGEVNSFIDEILDELQDTGSFELVERVAAELPVRVILRMLGVPVEDWPLIREASWQFLAASDPRFTIDGDAAETSKTGRRRLVEYCTALAIERRKNPKDDFTTIVAELEVDGSKLSIHEMATWFVSMVSGGLATTRNALSVGAWLFMTNQDQRTRLLEDPSLVNPMVEEVLRWATPARNRLRIVNEDMEFHDTQFRSGDWVIGLLSSANKDERVFENPQAFDIGRTPNPHLSLGIGTHMCLGRALVRLELGSLFPKLLQRFPDLHPVESTPRWIEDPTASGLIELPVEFTPSNQKLPASSR